MTLDLSTLSADEVVRISSWNPQLVVQALAASNVAASDTASTAAELNELHSVTAGTVSASKALVVDTNKRLDTIVIGTLKLGAAAGTAVTSTAAELNTLASSGITNADLVKVHAVTATAAEVSTLASSGITNADLVKVHAVTAAAATLNQVAAAAGTVTFDRSTKIAKVALAALDTGGGVLSWANPEAGSIIITRLVVDVTTKSTSACTVDFGTTAASATTSSDTFIDGVDVGTAVILADNVTNAGTNGKGLLKLATGKWVTGSMASGAAAGVVGSAYIHYANV